MNKKQTVIVFIILISSLILRFHNYAVYPQRGATSDEYSYSFLGVSLLTKGVPISWSSFTPYTHRSDLTIRGIYFPIVYPYFDHPPLNGIIVGLWALLHGESSFYAIQLGTIRVMPIIFSFISSILLFLITRKLYGYLTAVWALLIYSTTTIFVMNGRVVLAENLVTPFYLSALYIYEIYKKRLTSKYIFLLGVLSGLAFWTKELGITVFLCLLILFLYDQVSWKKIVLLSVTAVSFLMLYIAYGAYYDANLFWKIIGLQSGRNIGPETLYYILSTPIIINKVYFDGWYYVGFIALTFLLAENKANKLIIVPAMTYLFLLLFFLTQKGEMGWYIIPLFPFMAIATARLFRLSVDKHHWLLLLPVLFVGQYYISQLFETNFGLVTSQFRLLLLVLFAPLLIVDIRGSQKYFEKMGNIYFYVFIVINAYLTYTYVHPA